MKLVKIMLVALLSTSILLVAGCGEEEKYNKAKNEVLILIDQSNKVADHKDYESFTKDQAEEEYNKDIEEHNKVEQQIQDKLAEMKEYAIKDTKLNNDLLALEARVKEQSDTWNRVRINYIDIKRRAATYTTMEHIQVKGAI